MRQGQDRVPGEAHVNRPRRYQLVAILLAGTISGMSLAALVFLEFPYPAMPGLLVSAYAAFFFTGNRHGGFGSAFTENVVVFLSNFFIYYLFILAALTVARLLRQRSK